MADFTVAMRNLFHLGAYQHVINQLSTAASNTQSPDTLDQQCLLYRAYVAQGKYNLVLTDIAADSANVPLELKAIRTLAALLQFQQQQQLPSRADLALQQHAASEGQAPPQLSVEALEQTEQNILTQVQSYMEEPVNLLNPKIVVPVATLLDRLGQLEGALRTLAHQPKDLECVALTVQILLTINRTDLAQREVTAIKTWAEDDSLAQLIEAWVHLRLGGSKYREALYIFEELAQASPVPTLKLLNSQAICNLHLGRLPEAESCLLEALNKDSNDPDTLVNMLICANLLQKPLEVRNRYLNQLRDVAPAHPFLHTLEQREALFHHCATAVTGGC
ncbi:hypothetical protein H4R34_000043 [Dimargaris verticillata]|uniref:Coatomer subunit epsilon n=1 Tax=Dimargaris verticillata TaxID=2761393 RepID=A0A9W8B7G0_9FUNG|nr:hypothetical protein H4R34_000043 [Dimargaris verticillata]